MKVILAGLPVGANFFALNLWHEVVEYEVANNSDAINISEEPLTKMPKILVREISPHYGCTEMMLAATYVFTERIEAIKYGIESTEELLDSQCEQLKRLATSISQGRSIIKKLKEELKNEGNIS